MSNAVLISLLIASAPPVTALAVAPQGNLVVAGSQAGLEVRSWPELQVRRRLPTRMPHVHDLAFSPRGDMLAAAGGTPAQEGAVELYRWPGGELVARHEPHRDLVYAVAWRNDGLAWAAASADHGLKWFDVAADRLAGTLQGHSREVLAICFLAGGELVSGGGDQSLRVWNPANGQELRSLYHHTDAVVDLDCRPGQPAESLPMVASISADRTVRFWQPTVGRMVRFARLPSEPLAAAWLVGGDLLAVSCADGHVRLIDPATVTIEHDMAAIEGWAYCVAVHPDGDALIVGGENGRIKRVSVP